MAKAGGEKFQEYSPDTISIMKENRNYTGWPGKVTKLPGKDIDE